MIPKILHYCWFGTADKPDTFKECYNSWKKHCSDWELREWTDKDLVELNSEYINLMYHHHEYAFVADYVRMYALHAYGGLYVDTDVILHRSPEDLLANDLVLLKQENYENCFIMSEPRNTLFTKIMEDLDTQLIPKHLEYDTLSDRHGYCHLNRYNHKNPTSHIKEVGFFISK